MKGFIAKVASLCLGLFLVCAMFFSVPVMAEGESEAEQIMAAATSISISPVSKILQLLPDTTYEDTFKVTNNGSSVMDFEVYASPYSYSYSEDDDEYKLGFSNENTFTQITRWITFADANGNYVEKARYQAQPGDSVEVSYRISTPSSIPGGGQYAVLFAHTLSNSTTASGIKTEASPGLVVYGRSNGETITSSEIRDLKLSQSIEVDGEKKSLINASAKVKNTGNVDFMAQGKLKVEGIFGRSYYETEGTSGRVSVIPETELSVSDTWENTPYFGLFKATWTVSAAGSTETTSQLILILPLPILVAFILLLTIIIVWIIIFIRKRKERRSRFMI
ncbi:hypothetical protein IJ118_00335 [Candidatus Saccharibacteria bacterium]|nr:hypothetical protein [Candidatus Saccharibacteria bacterium]